MLTRLGYDASLPGDRLPASCRSVAKVVPISWPIPSPWWMVPTPRSIMLDLHPSIAQFLALPEPMRRIGSFVLLRQLGRGGFAPVWLAKEVYGHEVLRPAAVKLFTLAGADGAALLRIVEEARALCRVEHPNVVRFYSLAVDESAGLMGLGMEYIAGRTLATRLSSAGPMRVEQLMDLAKTLASALATVHRAGLVHRDVKPANIVEAADGYKLIDFGIASANTHLSEIASWKPSADPDCTGRIAALQSGTLGYVDPVTIATGAAASPESDLYALGATLYECATDRLPAGSRSKPLNERILDGREIPQSIAQFADGLPPEFVTLIDRMVHPDRIRRFASADEVLARLREMRPSRPMSKMRGFQWAVVASMLPIALGIGVWMAHRVTTPMTVGHEPQPFSNVVTEAKIEPPQEVWPAANIPKSKTPETAIATHSRRAQRFSPRSHVKSARRADGTNLRVEVPATAAEPAPPPKPAATASTNHTGLPLAPARDW